MTWKTVLSVYQVDVDGNVRNSVTGHVLSQRVNNRGYRTVQLRLGDRNTSHLVHRLVALAHVPNSMPGVRKVVDHVDNNVLHNAAANLRWATHAENAANTPKRPNAKATSIYKGVVGKKGRWYVRINVGSEMRYGGAHATEVAAARAYDVLARQAFGEFAVPNLPPPSS